jgi:hypothetical protein
MSEQGGSEVVARSLIYIPIIHTPSDMGEFKGTVQRLQTRMLGRRGLERNVSFIEKLWTRIDKTVDQLILPYERVRIYQDGLPVCGREAEIVADLARNGSRNHRILTRLCEKGATLMGTESSALLIEEYEMIKGILSSGQDEGSGSAATSQKVLSDSILRRRDTFIARRINETLLANETGILFLGMLHDLAAWLDQDIHVTYPLDFETLSHEILQPTRRE